MKFTHLLLTVAPLALATPVWAAPSETAAAANKKDDSDMVTTGVARGRDRLDSATSTSSIKESEINKLAPRSLDDLFRNLPGIRVEGGAGDALNAYTVRGLPLVNGGAKYLQIQEDGLPVLEFGDLANMGPDAFVRADLNIASVESIRGGSASTFASNAPGGVVNLISKTGDVEGGSVQLSAGGNYDSNRVDFEYGSKLGGGWRFHVGGFYREGEGPRETGYVSTRGGQVKFNATKTFDGGYIRFYGKVLDDKTPVYIASPMKVTGTNDKPTIGALPQFDAVGDTLMSRNIGSINMVDTGGNVVTNNLQNGFRVKSKSLGTEVQFSLGEWSFTERFRYSDMSGSIDSFDPQLQIGAATIMLGYFVPGGSLQYATGPNAGQTITPSSSVSGNGLLSLTTVGHTNINSLQNVTNDFRTSRVWNIEGGDLTTTAGVYKSYQKLDRDYYGAVIIQDLVGGGNSALINVKDAAGHTVFANGMFSYDDSLHRKNRVNVDYNVLAPYASFNFHKGKIAIGGSVRYDIGRVTGSIARNNASKPIDVDGVANPFDRAEIGASNSAPVGIPYIGGGASQPVNYRYDYVSYSVGVNYRVAESFSLFARHSLGGRAGADALLFSPAISATSGALVDQSASHDSVRQSEVGLKYRKNGITLNLTGFYATTKGTYLPNIPDYLGIKTPTLVSRSYKTYGAEFEGGIRRGAFVVNGSATITGGEITAAESANLVGKEPRRQPTLMYSITPQYDVDRFTIGANVGGQTSSYADDVDQLRMPGYTLVGVFGQYRPVDRLVLGVNVSNLFDKTAVAELNSTAIPASGVATVRTLYGRMISASARFFF